MQTMENWMSTTSRATLENLKAGAIVRATFIPDRDTAKKAHEREMAKETVQFYEEMLSGVRTATEFIPGKYSYTR